MGQAKRRGSLEERQQQGIIKNAEIEAWREYYRREEKRLEKWFFDKASMEEKLQYTRYVATKEAMMGQLLETLNITRMWR